MQNEHTQLVRGLGLIAAISVNVANIIGTGVFLKARVVTCNVGSPSKALMVWVFAGLLSLAGALTYAELLAMMPRAAGEYGIMRDAYGRPIGFIYGWTQFLIARTASAAALAVGFAIFFNDLVGGVLKHSYFEYTLAGWTSTFVRPIGNRRVERDRRHDVDQLRRGTREWRSGQRAYRNEDRAARRVSVSARSFTATATGAISP